MHDNPLQDVPLIAVLRSPLVGLSLMDWQKFVCSKAENFGSR